MKRGTEPTPEVAALCGWPAAVLVKNGAKPMAAWAVTPTCGRFCDRLDAKATTTGTSAYSRANGSAYRISYTAKPPETDCRLPPEGRRLKLPEPSALVVVRTITPLEQPPVIEPTQVLNVVEFGE